MTKRSYCADCGTTYDERGLCACTEPDWLRAEVQRLQSEVQRLQAEVDRLQEEWLTAYADGIKNGFQSGAEAGQEAMRERCAVRVDRAANEACECDGTLCGPDDVQRRVRELRERIAEERRAR